MGLTTLHNILTSFNLQLNIFNKLKIYNYIQCDRGYKHNPLYQNDPLISGTLPYFKIKTINSTKIKDGKILFHKYNIKQS